MQTLENIGDTISYTVGRVAITLQWVREDAYSVTAYRGTLRIDEWCKAHPVETDARIWARMVVQAASIEEGLPQPCGCGGLGWICTGALWWPCSRCNQDRHIVAASDMATHV